MTQDGLVVAELELFFCSLPVWGGGETLSWMPLTSHIWLYKGNVGTITEQLLLSASLEMP